MGKRIMVIDDDLEILTIMEIILEGEGYDVVLHSTGTTTNHIKVIDPDLIIIDFRIAGYAKTGAEICTEIKSEHVTENIPVLLFSAEYGVDVIARSCGANGFIKKPFEIVELLQKVKKFAN